MNSTTEPATDSNIVIEREALIDLAAITSNVESIRSIVSPAALMAVVKADAYGHGMVQVARAALAGGATWLGTAHISEALALRSAGIHEPLLAWLHTSDTDFEAAINNGIDIGCSGWDLDRVAQAARATQCPARVHVKIDTGLGRNGSTLEDWDSLIARAIAYQDDGLLRVVGIFSHFAVADEPDRAETDEQIRRFKEAVAVAEDAGADLEVRHIANTPGVFTRPDAHFDLVRVGLGLYGLSPFADRTSAQLGLIPAMTLRARVANLKDVKAGQGVSYGLNYRTETPTTLALIPLGYADGIPRIATGGPVRINGRSYQVVGRIAMDQMVIDAGPDGRSAMAVGDVAELFGTGQQGGPLVEEWAEAAGTINYEVVTRISPRVPRRYVTTETPGEATVAGNEGA